jgi:energy-converting hydrogenase A subunit R
MASAEVAGSDVMYVGDSITDVPPLESVREWGGVSLSFNGNAYALAAAEFAAASPDAAVIGDLAEAFAGDGRQGVEHAVRAWPRPKKGVVPTGRARACVGIVEEELKALAEASAMLRRSVRGERVARLG